jgi:hypothetical protein
LDEATGANRSSSTTPPSPLPRRAKMAVQLECGVKQWGMLSWNKRWLTFGEGIIKVYKDDGGGSPPPGATAIVGFNLADPGSCAHAPLPRPAECKALALSTRLSRMRDSLCCCRRHRLPPAPTSHHVLLIPPPSTYTTSTHNGHPASLTRPVLCPLAAVEPDPINAQRVKLDNGVALIHIKFDSPEVREVLALRPPPPSSPLF